MIRITRVLLLIAAMFVFQPCCSADDLQRVAVFRQPVAIFSLPSTGGWVTVNQRPGTVSLIDGPTSEVVAEVAIGVHPTAAARLNEDHLLITDDETHALLAVEISSTDARRTASVAVGKWPVGVAVQPEGAGASVASSWSRRLTFVDASDVDSLQVVRVVDLPFAPRHQQFVDSDRLFVTDAFGGSMALVSYPDGEVVKLRTFLGTHNIGAVARVPGAKQLWITHQVLDAGDPTTDSNVHWGDIMSNVVRTVDLDWFLSDDPDETTASDLYYLGQPNRATGDPTCLVSTRSGRQLICFAGINHVGISDVSRSLFSHVATGHRPMAIALSADERYAMVVSRFSNTVTCVDVERSRAVGEVSLGPEPELTPVDMGERLFHDASLSSDGWFSCSSCHIEGHSNDLLSDTFGDGTIGSPKRVLSLRGIAATEPFAWNGKVESLQQQVAKSIRTTMRGAEPSDEQVAALVSYLQTLPPAPAVGVARGEDCSQASQSGEAVFRRAGCADCHAPPTFTTDGTYDVGIRDPEGTSEFNPPSLRGVSQRNRLLHDNRARSVREAIEQHAADEVKQLSADEWSALEAFLRNL